MLQFAIFHDALDSCLLQDDDEGGLQLLSLSCYFPPILVLKVEISVTACFCLI